MIIEEIKLEIEKQTGVPASLLKGETVEENIAQAKALLAYKQEHAEPTAPQQPQTPAEQFAGWFEQQLTVQTFKL